jgi:hypothetical protein
MEIPRFSFVSYGVDRTHSSLRSIVLHHITRLLAARQARGDLRMLSRYVARSKKGSIVFRLMQKWTNPFPPVNTTIYGPKYVISSFSSPNHDFWVVQMNGWDW